MLSLVIGIIVTTIAARLIIKNYQPQTVLLVAGLTLLSLTVLLFPEQSILYQKAKSVGWTGFDIFAFAKNSLSTQIAGIGLIIMASAGFSEYMDHIGATRAMVRVCVKPLTWFKAPYVILAAGYVLGQSLHVAIPSAAGLAMLLLVTLFPLMVSLGVSKPAAAAMIGLSGFMDLGPAVGTANLAAKTSGIPTAVYFVQHQIPIAIGVMLVVTLLVYFTARYFDRQAGHVVTPQVIETTANNGTEDRTPALYSLIPLLPIVLILVFSPLLVAHISMDVVTAMLIGALAGMLCELLVKRDIKAAFKGFQVFFNGVGSSFASIVSLLVCADIFAQGLQAIGTVNYLIQLTTHAGFGVNAMAVAMTLMVCVTGVITGSGVAAFFAFSGLAPEIATKFGVSAVTMILPMQLMAGMGRSISPVAGVIIAVSKTAGCSPFEVVRRTAIPAIGGILTMLLLNYLFNGQG